MIKRFLISLIAVTLPVAAWADLINIAQVSYRDPVKGTAFSATSNQVTVLVANTIPQPLPPLNLSGLDGKTYTLADEIAFNYNVTGVSFDWHFTPVPLPSSSPQALSGELAALTARAGAPSGTTAVPRASLSQFGLRPGRYQLTVTVSLGSQSQQGSAVLTIAVSDLVGVRVYPNPWRSDKHTGGITFAGLPANTTVKIFTTSGHLVKKYENVSNSVIWDRTNDSGETAASGLYVYVITTADGQSARGKVAIIK